MSSSEEYLENLLQSMMNGETPNSEPDAGKQKSAIELLSGEEPEHTPVETNAYHTMSPEEIEAMFASAGNVSAEENTPVVAEEDIPVAEEETVPVADESGISDSDALAGLDDILAAADMSFDDSMADLSDITGIDNSSDIAGTEESGIEEPETEEPGMEGSSIDDDLAALLEMGDLALEESSMDEMPDMSLEESSMDEMPDMSLEEASMDEMLNMSLEEASMDEMSDMSLEEGIGEIGGMDDLSDLLGSDMDGIGMDGIGMDDIGVSEFGMDESGESNSEESGMESSNIDDDLAALLGMGDLALEESGMDEMPDMSLEEGSMEEMPDMSATEGVDEIGGMDDLADLLGSGMDESGESNMEEAGMEDSGMDDELAALLGMGNMTSGESGMDEDMAELNGFLEKSGSEDDDMMALLKSAADSAEPDFQEAEEDAMNFFNSGVGAEGNSERAGESSDKKDKKEKKKKEKKAKKERKFGKKKKGNQEENQSENQTEEQAEGNGLDELGIMDGLEGLAGLEGLDDMGSMSDGESKSKENGKKKGFFAKFIDFLMEEDDEEGSGAEKNLDPMDELLLGETSNENKELLDELSEEDKNKKKKKDKKGKKTKKGKKNQKGQDAQVDENDEEGAEEESAKPKKKKRPKKEKKKKETEEVLNEKPEKKLSKKKVIPVILFCATIAAAIIVLSSVVPSYLQKRDAHVAYDLGNYEEAYNLLCDKELSEEDEVILHKSRIILKMERKLEAYETYQKMNDKELESLDTLLQGVALYYDLLPYADEYYVTGEINDVYKQILDILAEKYGLSEVDAVEIATCDNNVTYTEYLRTIIYGAVYEDVLSEETADDSDDILPEEQEILDGMSAEE